MVNRIKTRKGLLELVEGYLIPKKRLQQAQKANLLGELKKVKNEKKQTIHTTTLTNEIGR